MPAWNGGSAGLVGPGEIQWTRDPGTGETAVTDRTREERTQVAEISVGDQDQLDQDRLGLGGPIVREPGSIQAGSPMSIRI